MLSGILHGPPSLYSLNKYLLSRPAALLLEETRVGTCPTRTATGLRPSVRTKATPRSLPTGPALQQQPQSSLQQLALPMPRPVARVTSLLECPPRPPCHDLSTHPSPELPHSFSWPLPWRLLSIKVSTVHSNTCLTP